MEESHAKRRSGAAGVCIRVRSDRRVRHGAGRALPSRLGSGCLLARGGNLRWYWQGIRLALMLDGGTRIMLGTFVLLVLVLLILASIGYYSGGWENDVRSP